MEEILIELVKWLSSSGLPLPAIIIIIAAIIIFYFVIKWNETKRENKSLEKEKESLEKQKADLKQENADLKSSLSDSRRNLSRSVVPNNNGLENRVLTGQDSFDVMDAIVKLGQFPETPQSLNCLKNRLRNEEDGDNIAIRWHILKVLQQFGSYEAMSLLVKKGFSDNEPTIKAHAINLVGQSLSRKLIDEDNKTALNIEKLLLEKLNNSHEYRCVKTQSHRVLRQLNCNAIPSLPIASSQIIAYVFIKGPKGTPNGQHVTQLKNIKDSNYGAIVAGGQVLGDWDFIVKVLAKDLESLNEIVMRRFHGLGWIESTRTLIVINEPRFHYWRREAHTQNNNGNLYRAYLLIRTPALTTGGIISCLMDINGVTEAAGLYGGSDVIAKIEANNQEQRDKIIVEKVGKIPFVEFTQTYVVTVTESLQSWDDTDDDTKFDFPYGNEWRIPRRT